jgi:hypothetical protein
LVPIEPPHHRSLPPMLASRRRNHCSSKNSNDFCNKIGPFHHFATANHCVAKGSFALDVGHLKPEAIIAVGIVGLRPYLRCELGPFVDAVATWQVSE